MQAIRNVCDFVAGWSRAPRKPVLMAEGERSSDGVCDS